MSQSPCLNAPMSDKPASSSPQPGNRLEGFLGYQIRRASAAILADLAQSLQGLDLKITEASILMLIGERPDITQSELGRLLGIKRANMAPLTAGLTEAGLIERIAADGRSQGLRLSEAGHAVAIDVEARIIDHETRVLPWLSDDERRALIATMMRVWR